MSREEALGRLFDYYQYAGSRADALLARQPWPRPASAGLVSPPSVVPDLRDSVQALSWARAERANLTACLDHAARTGQHARLVGLTAAMTWESSGTSSVTTRTRSRR